jgi:hypothetical protein
MAHRPGQQQSRVLRAPPAQVSLQEIQQNARNEGLNPHARNQRVTVAHLRSYENAIGVEPESLEFDYRGSTKVGARPSAYGKFLRDREEIARQGRNEYADFNLEAVLLWVNSHSQPKAKKPSVINNGHLRDFEAYHGMVVGSHYLVRHQHSRYATDVKFDPSRRISEYVAFKRNFDAALAKRDRGEVFIYPELTRRAVQQWMTTEQDITDRVAWQILERNFDIFATAHPGVADVYQPVLDENRSRILRFDFVSVPDWAGRLRGAFSRVDWVGFLGVVEAYRGAGWVDADIAGVVPAEYLPDSEQALRALVGPETVGARGLSAVQGAALRRAVAGYTESGDWDGLRNLVVQYRREGFSDDEIVAAAGVAEARRLVDLVPYEAVEGWSLGYAASAGEVSATPGVDDAAGGWSGTAPGVSPELAEWLRQPDGPTSRQYFLDHREGLRASTRVLRELAALSTSDAGLAVHQALMTLDAHDPPEAHDLLDAGYRYLSPSAPPDRKDLLTNLIGTAKADVLQAFTALADRVLAQARLDEHADVETLESEEAVAEVLKIVRNILQGAEGTRVLAAKFVVSLSGTRKVSLVQQLLDLITVMHQHEAELTILAESMIVACPTAELRKLPQEDLDGA